MQSSTTELMFFMGGDLTYFQLAEPDMGQFYEFRLLINF